MNSRSETSAHVPDQASTLLQQGRSHLKAGRHGDALAIADRLLKEYEETPETLQFACEVHFTRANFVESERLAKQCSDQFPNDYGGPVLRCRALQALGKLGEARELALAMADKDITADSHIAILVTTLSGCLVPEAAYPLCKKSVALDPYNAAAHRRLALTCRLIGKIDEAVEAANVALKFDPHDYEMIGLRSNLRTVAAEDNHVAELEALLSAGCRNALGGARVAYSLAKECEDIGEYERSFQFLEAGAVFKRENTNYTIGEDLKTYRTLQEVFTAEALASANSGFETEEPIFILGLPRTGSTLVERIISSHSGVYAAGELNHFSAAMMEEIRKSGPLADRTDLVGKSLQADMLAIGRRYLNLTRPSTGHTPHFIDKLPLNFLSLGVIHLALPKAKIIHVRRTPLDACYAIYKFLFNQAYSWSYNLGDIAQYYIGYRQLMDHWRTAMPGRIIDVTYEDVVEDLEGEARHLVADLSLDWEPACLEFHENTAAAMTGSAVQVRQKIYASSVGRWRDYEAQLKPLADALEAAGIDPFQP
ncbi:MAG: sulfotransferase [Proteobacteria bacterium]|nr:sulfotransferase [Pseudomonadota bacterium]